MFTSFLFDFVADNFSCNVKKLTFNNPDLKSFFKKSNIFCASESDFKIGSITEMIKQIADKESLIYIFHISGAVHLNYRK